MKSYHAHSAPNGRINKLNMSASYLACIVLYEKRTYRLVLDEATSVNCIPFSEGIFFGNRYFRVLCFSQSRIGVTGKLNIQRQPFK